jgi:peroxiredoxin
MVPADDGSYHAAVLATIGPERRARSQASAAGLIASGITQQARGVGAQAPDFALPDSFGHSVALAELREAGPVVLDAATQQRYRDTGIDLAVFNGDATWTLPMPGSFIIDRAGVIRLAFVQADYTQRPEPAAILVTLAALTG